MSPQATQTLRVFIASPSDVGPERIVARDEIRLLSDDCRSLFGITVQAMMWEDHLRPCMGNAEEQIIDQLELLESDVFVGILWNRFGTPPGGAPDGETGSPFQSGTEKEFRVALRCSREKQRPSILFYRCTRPATLDTAEEIEQRKNVVAFFDEFWTDGRHEGYPFPYESPAEFGRDLRRHLFHEIVRICNIDVVPEDSAAGDSVRRARVVDVYYWGDNQRRNRAKRASLETTSSMKLLAHTGHAYLADGAALHSAFCARLADGMKARILLINPWSLCGFMLAFADASEDARAALCSTIDRNKRSRLLAKMTTDAYFYRRKFQFVIERYQQLTPDLRSNLEVRATLFDAGATILLTDTDAFCEPYLFNSPEMRRRIEMDTFELHVEQTSYLWDSLSQHFDQVWTLAVPFDEVLAGETQNRKLLQQVVGAALDGIDRSE